MSVAITHTKVATLPDDPSYEVGTSEWNDDHAIAVTGPALVGKLTAGAGDAIEVTPQAVAASVWLIKTADYTAVSGDSIYCDTTGGVITITLPASPATPAVVEIASGPYASTNNLTIGRNGHTIMSLSENMTVSKDNASFKLIYNGTTWGIA